MRVLEVRERGILFESELLLSRALALQRGNMLAQIAEEIHYIHAPDRSAQGTRTRTGVHVRVHTRVRTRVRTEGGCT